MISHGFLEKYFPYLKPHKTQIVYQIGIYVSDLISGKTYYKSFWADGLTKDDEYNTIYLDLKMPHISGFDILRIINEDIELSSSYKNKIILITALAQNKDTVQLRENHLVNKIMFKPIRIRDL